MKNPWEKIPLSDYENHMSLDSVMQLQTLNEMMKEQLSAYPISSVMILGIAGGNGLEYIQNSKIKKVYGVDINAAYLDETARRYPHLQGILKCLRIDLMNEADRLPKSDLVIADLLIEYIGYKCFQQTLQVVRPEYVSCIIQINTEKQWVSDSPYFHVFDDLEQVHHQMSEQDLVQTMLAIHYQAIQTVERQLPNGKKLVRFDFKAGE